MKILKEELKLNKEVYEFIVNNRYLIDKNNFDELFEKAENQIPYYTQDLYKFFYKRYPELLFSITKIPYSMFRYSNIDDIEIPSNIKIIDFKAFEKSDIHRITFNEGLTTINSEAFYGCESLQNVKLPNSLEILGRSTFARCNNLKSISIGDNVKEIKSTTFEASGIEEIELPKQLLYIHDYAFSTCIKLNKLVMPLNLKIINYRAFNFCVNLKDLVLNEGLEEIRQEAFWRCYSLLEVKIPNTVKILGDEAFSECTHLHTVYISPNTKLGSKVFSDCKDLFEIKFDGTGREWVDYISNVPKDNKEFLNANVTLLR